MATTTKAATTRSKTISYSQAIAEIEQILSQINSSQLEIDTLGVKVKRANELIAICKERLLKVQDDVEKIIAKDQQ
ncbi:MAG: exodeoxyribonuclease VII small subunit [Rikenellaceae bacterium]